MTFDQTLPAKVRTTVRLARRDPERHADRLDALEVELLGLGERLKTVILRSYPGAIRDARDPVSVALSGGVRAVRELEPAIDELRAALDDRDGQRIDETSRALQVVASCLQLYCNDLESAEISEVPMDDPVVPYPPVTALQPRTTASLTDLAKHVLSVLQGRPGVWIPTDDLARSSGWERGSMGNAVSALRKVGYEIENRRGWGYRLVS